MAMAPRLRNCIAAWICSGFSDGCDPAQSEVLAVRPVPASAGTPVCSWFQRWPGGEPDRVHHPLNRNLDADRAADDTVGHLFAEADRAERPHPVSPHAGFVRLFLCRPAFHHLRLAGSVLRSGRYREGHRQTALHHGRLRCAHATRSTCRHVDPRHDASPGPPLAATAPPDLSDRPAGRGPLPVAGEERSDATADIRRDTRPVAGLAPAVGTECLAHCTEPTGAAR